MKHNSRFGNYSSIPVMVHDGSREIGEKPDIRLILGAFHARLMMTRVSPTKNQETDIASSQKHGV